MIESGAIIKIIDTKDDARYKTNAYLGYKRDFEARYRESLIDDEEIMIARRGKIMDYKEFLSNECAAWIRFCIKDMERFGELPECIAANIDDEMVFVNTIDGKLWRKGKEALGNNIYIPEEIDQIEYAKFYEGVINVLFDVCPNEIRIVKEIPKKMVNKETFGERLARTFF